MSNIIDFPTTKICSGGDVTADSINYKDVVQATFLLCASLSSSGINLFHCEVSETKLSNGKLNISIQELRD